MKSMLRNISFLWMKELKDYFYSPLVYVLSAFFSLVLGWLFFNYLANAKELTSLTLSSAVLMPIMSSINQLLLFLMPLITMRTLAEEQKNQTLDLLLQSNLSPLQIILGKYLAAVSVGLFFLLWTLVFPLVLAFSGYNDWGTVLMGYVGIIFSMCCYVAVGVFASALTENQIVAAFVTFCLLLSFVLLVFSVNATNNVVVAQLGQYLSFSGHYESLVRGAGKTYSLIYYVSFIGFFIYLAHVKLQSRKW